MFKGILNKGVGASFDCGVLCINHTERIMKREVDLFTDTVSGRIITCNVNGHGNGVSGRGLGCGSFLRNRSTFRPGYERYKRTSIRIIELEVALVHR